MFISASLLPAEPSIAVTLIRIQLLPAMSSRCWREWYVLLVTVASVTQPFGGRLPAAGRRVDLDRVAAEIVVAPGSPRTVWSYGVVIGSLYHPTTTSPRCAAGTDERSYASHAGPFERQ